MQAFASSIPPEGDAELADLAGKLAQQLGATAES